MRFHSKKAFVEDIQREYQGLKELLADLDEKQMTQSGACGKWSVKDILAHLHEWHSMALSWYEVGLTGQRAAIPAPKDIPALNKRIYEKHKSRPLKQVLAAFEESHRKMTNLVDSLSEKELLTPGYLPWTRKNPLTSYLSPNLGSHYRWPIRHIRRWKKAQQAPGRRTRK